MIRLNEQFIPPDKRQIAERNVQKLVRLLQNGDLTERHTALIKLVAEGAESALTHCLRSTDATTVQLATAGLWECWLNEKGPHARQKMDQGVELMNQGDLAGAEKIFLRLAKKYPDW